MKRFLAVLAVLLIAAVAAQAQIIFQDDFENGLGNWTAPTAGGEMEWSTAQNIVPDGAGHSAYANMSLDRIYHNLGTEITGVFKATWWIYDSSMTRTFGEMRAHTGSTYNTTQLQGLFAAGKYNSVTMTGEVHNASKYQARISTAGFGWFNLDAEGSVNRKAGWHKFDVVRLQDGKVQFFVDDKLGREFTNVPSLSFDCIDLGFNTNSSSNGDTWYDGVMVAVPEPSSFVALASGLAGMAGFAIRRRKS